MALDDSYGVVLDTDADYLNLLTRKLFHAGFDKALVNRRWSAFERAFVDFSPARVAAMTEDDVLRLSSDAGIIRNRVKLRATVANAKHFVEVANTHGSWGRWLASKRHLPYEQRYDTLRACLTGCGPTTIFYFLLEAGEATLTDRPEEVR